MTVGRRYTLIILLAFGCLLLASVLRPVANAQEVPLQLTPFVSQAVQFAVSPPISELSA